jgi:hypothetical protein
MSHFGVLSKIPANKYRAGNAEVSASVHEEVHKKEQVQHRIAKRTLPEHRITLIPPQSIHLLLEEDPTLKGRISSVLPAIRPHRDSPIVKDVSKGGAPKQLQKERMKGMLKKLGYLAIFLTIVVLLW